MYLEPVLTDPASFDKRLAKIMHQHEPRKREQKIERLLKLFNARHVIYEGRVVGYTLPHGERFCRKRGFRSVVQATKYAAGLDAERGLRAYECMYCGKVHLTSQRLRPIDHHAAM